MGVMLVTGFCLVFWGFLFLGAYLLGFVWCVSLFLCLLIWRGCRGCYGCFVLGVECVSVVWIGILFWCGVVTLWFLVFPPLFWFIFVWVGCCRGW